MDSALLRWRRAVVARAMGATARDPIALGPQAQIAFWVVALMLTSGVLFQNPKHVYGRVAGMLLTTVLVHELARSLAARMLRLPARVVLQACGPRMRLETSATNTRTSLILVFAGSTFNGLVASLALAVARHAPSLSSTLVPLAFCQGVYAIAHLLPFAPFDGHALLERLSPEKHARTLAACAGGLGLLSLFARFALHAPYLALGCALITIFPMSSLGNVLAKSRDDARARSETSRIRLLRALASSELAAGRTAHALAVMQRLPDDEVDVVMLATLLRLLGRDGEAVQLLQTVRSVGLRHAAVTKMLIDLHFARGDLAAVSTIASRDADLLSLDDRDRVMTALGDG